MSQRRNLIAKIHIAKTQLALDDATYRQAISSVTGGKRSCSDCGIVDLHKIITHFEKKGFKSRPPKKSGKRKQDKRAQASKIRALWLELHTLGYVNNPSESALAAWIKSNTRKLTQSGHHTNQKYTGIDDLHWVSSAQMTHLIERLKQWLSRDQNRAYKLFQKAFICSALPSPMCDIENEGESFEALKAYIIGRKCGVNKSQWEDIINYLNDLEL